MFILAQFNHNKLSPNQYFILKWLSTALLASPSAAIPYKIEIMKKKWPIFSQKYLCGILTKIFSESLFIRFLLGAFYVMCISSDHANRARLHLNTINYHL